MKLDSRVKSLIPIRSVMEASVILWIIIILAAGVVMTIVLTNFTKEDRKPVLKKSPAS